HQPQRHEPGRRFRPGVEQVWRSDSRSMGVVMQIVHDRSCSAGRTSASGSEPPAAGASLFPPGLYHNAGTEKSRVSLPRLRPTYGLHGACNQCAHSHDPLPAEPGLDKTVPNGPAHSGPAGTTTMHDHWIARRMRSIEV